MSLRVQSVFATIALLLRVEIGMSRNVLEYFHLESMLNYDIFIYSDFSIKQMEEIQTVALSSSLALAIGNINALINTDKDVNIRRNVAVLINPANKSEFYLSGNQILPSVTKFQRQVVHQPYVFLVWPDLLESVSTIQSIMGNLTPTLNFTLNTNAFVIFRRDGHEFLLWEIYSIKGQRFIQDVGIPDAQIDIANIIAKSSRRQNFNGIVITAVASVDDDYSYESKFSNDSGTLVLEGGFAANLYWDLRDMLNFSESFMGGDWMFVENETLQGAQAIALLDETADVCISQNVLRSDLAIELTFLQTTYPLSVIAFFKEPSSVNSVNIYNQPFDLYLCIPLFLLALLISALVKVFVSSVTNKNKSHEIDKRIGRDWIMWVIGTISQQGWHVFPSALPLRILFITGALSALVIYNAFSAVLVSRLSVQVSPIRSLRDLVYYDYTFIYNQNSVSLREFVKGMKSYYSIPKIEGYPRNKIGPQALKPRRVVLAYWEGIKDVLKLSTNLMDYICESMQAFPVENTVVHTGMTLKKGSPYEELFNQKILQLKERGFNQRYARHYSWATQPQCLHKSIVRHDPMELQSLFSAHLLLIAGLSGAFFCYILELYIFNRLNKILPAIAIWIHNSMPWLNAFTDG